MCKADECVIYEQMFSAGVARRRFTVVVLLGLVILSALVGLALLLATLFLGDPSKPPTQEGLKAASGLLASSVSVAWAKEVLDRWSALPPYVLVLNGIRRCQSLSAPELEAYWALAKDLSKKI